MEGTFDAKKRKRAYLRAVGPNEGAPAWTGSSIRNFDADFDDDKTGAAREFSKESTTKREGSDVGATAEEIDQQIEETLRGPDDRPFEDRQV